MLASRAPHAVLLVGPASVGKRSLAADLAAGLLCTGATGADRPCRECRGCRMVDHGNHPDLHQLVPEGPGGLVGIGGPGRARGVRDLVSELALMPVEGGHRVALIQDAHRMNEDAQSALLKTLEEPPPDTTLVLIADDEERLLPTVRSRCARVRLGTVGARDVEHLLGALGVADAPTAGRLARLTGGRPGLAVTYASMPEAMTMRGEIARMLLDLLGQGPAQRLATARELMARASTLATLLAPPRAEPSDAPRRRRSATPAAGSPAREATSPGASSSAAPGEQGAEPAAKASAADRRRAVALMLDLWLDLCRDLVLAGRGAVESVRDQGLLEELVAAAGSTEPATLDGALARLARARELVDANVSPELLVDVELLRWPRARRTA